MAIIRGEKHGYDYACVSRSIPRHYDKLTDKATAISALKKTEKVHEKVGKIKAQLSRIGWLYEIKYTEDKEKGVVTDKMYSNKSLIFAILLVKQNLSNTVEKSEC